MKRHLILSAILMVALGATLGIHSQALATTTHQFAVDSFFDIEYDLVTTRVTTGGNGAMTMSSDFDTEMLWLDLAPSNGWLIRESPTRRSQGRTWTPSPGDPDFDLLRVHSFFDVFFDIYVGGEHLYNTEPAHFYGESDSFFDITYVLQQDVPLSGIDGHVTVLKSQSTMDIDPVVPEPSSIMVLLTGVAGLVGFGIRRRNR